MLSERGQQNAKSKIMDGFLAKKVAPFNAANNPTGPVNFEKAENFLMHDALLSYINSQKNLITPANLGYNNGPMGPLALRNAMASFINDMFHPIIEVSEKQITFANGVTTLNNVIAGQVTDEGEALLLGMPGYGAFTLDMGIDNGTKIVHVPFEGVDPVGVECVRKYEEALERATTEGIKVRGLIICNPHNPLGRCYSVETLKALMKFCAKHDLHLISDEIYALSTFNVPGTKQPPPFTSLLSVDPAKLISTDYIHVLYGMSKDFAAAGLRLGCLITQNAELTKAARVVGRFHWPSEASSAIATRILEDQTFVQEFIGKSKSALGEAYAFATKTLDGAGINYHRGGNAALFIWVDLSPYLGTSKSGVDSWHLEEKLTAKLNDRGVLLDSGAEYHNETAGWYRVILSVERESLAEGLRRIIAVASES